MALRSGVKPWRTAARSGQTKAERVSRRWRNYGMHLYRTVSLAWNAALLNELTCHTRLCQPLPNAPSSTPLSSQGRVAVDRFAYVAITEPVGFSDRDSQALRGYESHYVQQRLQRAHTAPKGGNEVVPDRTAFSINLEARYTSRRPAERSLGGTNFRSHEGRGDSSSSATSSRRSR